MSRKPNKIKAAIQKWLGVPIGLTGADYPFWADWLGTSNSGKTVTVNSAIQLSTVWACVRLISETISTLPLRIYRKLPDGSREPAKDHPLYNLLCRRPNKEMTPSRFILMIVASTLLQGNAYIEKKRIAGRVVALDPLYPQYISVKRLDNGRLQYKYTYDSTNRMISEDNIIHIRGFGLDGICGLNPVQVGRDVLGAAMSADEAAAKVFANGMQASGFLTVDSGGAQGSGILTEPQRELIRQSLEKFSSSKNAGKTMVLEAGLKYQGITMNPEAAQMLQTRGFNVEEICRFYSVPPFMVGHMDKASSWASSVEGQNLHFLTSCLRPKLVNIEQEFAHSLLEAFEFDDIYFEFAVEGLLRADSAGRAAWYNTALQNGWMSRNEVRKLENLPPIEGGDIYTVQSALVPIENLGNDKMNMSAKAAKFVLKMIAANDSGNKADIEQGFNDTAKALDDGDPDGLIMAHALMSISRLKQAA